MLHVTASYWCGAFILHDDIVFELVTLLAFSYLSIARTFHICSSYRIQISLSLRYYPTALQPYDGLKVKNHTHMHLIIK